MGLFFTLLYILTAYLTPPVVFGPLGQYHAEIILAVPTIIFSILNLRGTNFLQLAQTWAAFGLLGACFMSLASTGWIGGAGTAMIDFIPSIIVFFFITANCKKKGHLQILFGVLFFVAAFVIIQAQLDPKNPNLLYSEYGSHYYMVMQNPGGEPLYRIQGLGVIGDPNDFAQFLLALIPGVFFFWGKGKAALNLIRVYLPVGLILMGIFLTHSRGALLGIGAVLVVAFRKKIGLIPSVIGGVVMLGGLMAVGFTGGREVSAATGEDRMEAWSIGLQLIRSHPLFGVGYQHFTDFYVITAHNTIVVCAAELGVLGLFFWVAFVLSSGRDCFVVSTYGLEDKAKEKQSGSVDAIRLSARHAAAAPMPNLAFAGPKLTGGPTSSILLDHTAMRTAPSTFVRPGENKTEITPETKPLQPSFFEERPAGLAFEELRRLANLVIFSMVGLFVTGWFISRAFAMVFFLYGGVATVVFRLAQESGMELPQLKFSRALKISIAPTILLVAIVYVILRIDHATR